MDRLPDPVWENLLLFMGVRDIGWLVPLTFARGWQGLSLERAVEATWARFYLKFAGSPRVSGRHPLKILPGGDLATCLEALPCSAEHERVATWRLQCKRLYEDYLECGFPNERVPSGFRHNPMFDFAGLGEDMFTEYLATFLEQKYVRCEYVPLTHALLRSSHSARRCRTTTTAQIA
jgi:hypothetical protein